MLKALAVYIDRGNSPADLRNSPTDFCTDEVQSVFRSSIVNEQVGGCCGVNPASNSDGAIRSSRASPNPPDGGEPKEHDDEEYETQVRRGLQDSDGLESVLRRQRARLKHRMSWRLVETQDV